MKSTLFQNTCFDHHDNRPYLTCSCYSPTNVSDEKDVVEFYKSFNQTVLHIPPYACLVIGGDFNAQVSNGFSYYSSPNRKVSFFLMSHMSTTF